MINNTNSYWWQDPDRHTTRPPSKVMFKANAAMKCVACHDYNQGERGSSLVLATTPRELRLLVVPLPGGKGGQIDE